MSRITKTVAIVGAEHPESLQAWEFLRDDPSIGFMLIGNKTEIIAKAESLKITLEGATFLDTKDEIETCLLASQMASEGTIQVIMKGAVHTADFLRAILHKDFGLLPSDALLSHVAQLNLPWYHKPLLLTDAAVSILPDIDKKVQIISNAITVAHAMGIEQPKVALVCPVETVNPRIISTTDASQLVFLQKNTAIFENAVVEGPFGLDVAISKHSAQVKKIEGQVPGDADILVFGNLDAANATYKAFLSVPNVISAGIVVGAKIPIVLTSRSDSMSVRVASLKLALEMTG